MSTAPRAKGPSAGRAAGGRVDGGEAMVGAGWTATCFAADPSVGRGRGVALVDGAGAAGASAGAGMTVAGTIPAPVGGMPGGGAEGVAGRARESAVSPDVAEAEVVSS